MYRRSDPRWNRTLQQITENLEHANDTAQENIYGFTQRYIDPCFASVTRCVSACTAPCFPSGHDRRRHRARSRGRAESSFDFYDDWDHDDETDGLLGWGSDSLDRFLGSSAGYGATTQPAMGYGQRSRDVRYNTPRRNSKTKPRTGPLARDTSHDPTLIPSSSYFGFLGRLPFNIGARGLRYKPSAADLIDHPGAARRSLDEDQPLVDDSDHDDHGHAAARTKSEHKGHRRQRSDTHASGHTTDSLSSRGDIFPSEDELEDAVPLDDEFTIALERRTTGQWTQDSASSNRPSVSRLSTRTTHRPSPADTTDCIPTLAHLDEQEERLRQQQDDDVDRKRHNAHHLAVKRGLASDPASPLSPTPTASTSRDHLSFASTVDAQSIPDTGLGPLEENRGQQHDGQDQFVPARLPHFGSG
ncbi:hypothetical protein COCC4DRAFT_153712 [Bipolaris maydis ATCC 48331]|uniref:Uncharacterized protein n=2 Tax=Cochliobolus heterostrophus TaxID=5016 RepID=M2TF47_COCH5|nr:uncharacterized protein COCC4DRAFT_153712 [Bipolaris maydis ATCC 48331]EMD85129.1 hypothetical protein COCHEDRAFT_1219649 [Bipolaris maydis C5]KAH7559918.1 hypothetical protein BM1_03552 [Bipolaris maydis]ENH99207.1 hypothetical protein COCC4DRAFT_153712 [Bipolaris maydis ATCC 48331]KAJ5022479.1 hypothetical protein J3E73DRAFT_400965 [Bipolaris maydis]KAJ5064808.1 hypothetical protein J3E74DRAFT_445240 [Bipolaris maydis]